MILARKAEILSIVVILYSLAYWAKEGDHFSTVSLLHPAWESICFQLSVFISNPFNKIEQIHMST